MELCFPKLRYIQTFSPGYIVIHIITDFFLATLLVPLIWKIRKDVLILFPLVTVLSLGVLAAIAGIRQSNVGPLDKHDSSSIWSFNELCIGIIAASLVHPSKADIHKEFQDKLYN